MNSFKIPLLKVIGLLALAMLLAAGCSETPEDPDANIVPNTSITSYNIGISPDSSTATLVYYTAEIFWGGSDPDGETQEYRYWIDSDDPTETAATSVQLSLGYSTSTTSYTFNVQTRDNANAWDATAATMEIAIATARNLDAYLPDTKIVTGPSNGSLTGTGINVAFSGSDIDGYVVSYEYKIDTDSAWSSVANDLVAGSATLNILNIPTGARTLKVRSIDNFGKIDPSPVAVSFITVDTLVPDLSITSGAISNAFFFLPAGGIETDIQTGWVGDAAWYFSTIEYRFRVDSTTWSDWQDDNSALLEALDASGHTLDVEGRDLGGNSTVYTTAFGVGSLVGDRGVLVMNGIHFGTYVDEAWDFWNGLTILTDYDADFWDAFGGQDYSNNAELATRLVSTGAVPGDSLGNYSSFLMVMNGYNGDLEVYQSMIPLLVSYLNAGGNILVAGRYGSDFITGDIRSYAHVSYGAIGANISSAGLTAQVAGMVDMTGAGLSFTDLPNTPSHEDVTVLLLAPDYPGNIGGFITQPATSGKLAHIAGREYRFDIGPVNTNYSFILSNYFGEQ